MQSEYTQNSGLLNIYLIFLLVNQLWQALLPLVLAGSAAATVSCSTKEINLIQNPSFEAGLDNWTVYRGAIDALRGPDSADDDYYLYDSSQMTST
jgi:hypothetical protein